MLLYANRATSPKLHFRIHGQMTLRDLSVLDSEPRLGAEFCFNLYDGKKAILLAASNQQEKMQWMEDIAEAAQVEDFFGRTFLSLHFICQLSFKTTYFIRGSLTFTVFYKHSVQWFTLHIFPGKILCTAGRNFDWIAFNRFTAYVKAYIFNDRHATVFQAKSYV